MGGVYIALSALGNLIANFTIGGGAGKFVGAAVFPTGLMLVVLVGGSIFIAYISYLAGNYSSPEFAKYVVGVAEHKVHLTFVEALASGFLCNVLVAIGVWFALAAKDLAGKILAIWFPIMLFILGGFQHVVPNMYYVSMGKILMSSIYSPADMGIHFLAVTIGNFLSGTIFLPLIYKKLYMND